MVTEPLTYWEGMFRDDDEDDASTKSLVALIRERVVASGEVQIYPVWNNDEHLPPRGTIDVLIDELDSDTFFFNERFFYRILPNAS